MKFTPEKLHLDQALELWGLNENLIFHRYVANYIYFANQNNKDVVLRLTPSSHRTREEVDSELEFVKFLSDKGLKTVIPVKSFQGHFVETIIHDTLIFHACVFVKIDGKRTPDEESITTAHLNKWGAYLGKLHNYSEDFSNQAFSSSRAFWDQDSIQMLAEKNIPNAPAKVQTKFSEIMTWLKGLETNSKNFGVIHGDLNLGNYFIVDNDIISFDYDDSSKHWFMYDIAACLSSVLKRARTVEMRSCIIKDFFVGYQSERRLEQVWMDRFEKFYQYRMLIVYNWMNAMIGEGRFSEATINDWKSYEQWYLDNL